VKHDAFCKAKPGPARYDRLVVDEALRQAVMEAAGRLDVREAVGGLYDDVRREIDRRRPVCAVSGRCCRFEEFGHRLFVTTAELATFVHGLKNEQKPERRLAVVAWDGAGCPFQSNKLCGVHAIRPFGCRMFFCDATSTQWQNEAYEQFHARLKRLHEDLGVPYFYVEWRQALRALELSGTRASF
jgi:Fe-S-cluster containining protein